MAEVDSAQHGFCSTLPEWRYSDQRIGTGSNYPTWITHYGTQSSWKRSLRIRSDMWSWSGQVGKPPRVDRDGPATRASDHPRHGHDRAVPLTPTWRNDVMKTTHGTKADGTPITDEMIEAMADEAERGYDVEELRRRRGGRPALGSSPSTVESVRLDPELKRDLLLRAAAKGVSVSEAIREALRQYVQAS